VHDHARSARQENRQRLGLVLGLTVFLLALEGTAGVLTHSLALLADAAHMLADVAALGLSLVAMRFAERPATPQRTFGFYRVEILAALANAVALIVLSGFILIESWERLRRPVEVRTLPMLIVASAGLAVNLWSISLLSKGSRASLNVKAAHLEVFSDALTSLGVIVAAVTILLTGWHGADAVVSGAIALFILPRTWRLLKDAVQILLEGTPSQVDLATLRETLRHIPGVLDVHDLHVWSLTSGVHAMSAHVIRADEAAHDDVLGRVREAVLLEFAIHHVTLQVESLGCEETHP
jgi:cobalt-zinc-cadmium efflux system protein